MKVIDKALVLGALLIATASPASAQSKKYPPVQTDKDREAEEKSRVWESALHPDQHSYEDLVAANEGAITRDGRPERVKVAIAELDKAVALQPRRHEAYQLRGAGYDRLQDWARCAKDLEAADALAPRDPDDPRFEHRRRLGVCQARAGTLTAAEQTLAKLTSAGTRDGETWMRLGEVRIALGKLDEAITALTFAANDADTAQATARWLLALAYDRARMPSQAAEALAAAYSRDSGFSLLANPPQPFLGVAESDYMLGLAYGLAAPTPRPEVQLIYFQRYLRLAVDSPWRKRAEEHVKELRVLEFPERKESLKRGHGAALDLDVALGAIRKGMPAMRQCMAKTPGTILTVMITRVGPRSPTPPPPPPIRPDPFAGRRPQPRMTLPPAAGVSITQDPVILAAVPRAELDAAIRCLEPLADKLKLPPVKEKDSAYAVTFSVVGP
ncbi:MAG: hypothetical protein NT062_13380 [Proteobacteria bacterium]|nr:hypothetical protein [Pseudomonadota bacterium]